MSNDHIGACELIAGALLAMAVFAFHPSHALAAPILGPFTLSQLVHGTALLAVPLLGLGMWQMGAWLGLNLASVRLALIVAGLAMAMTVSAAMISNFVTPVAARASMAAMHQTVAAERSGPARPASRHPRMKLEQMPPLIQVSVAMNRGLAQVHVAYLSLAILLFAWALRRLSVPLAAIGGLVAAGPLLWQLSGRFSPETTTMPWVVFPQSLWFIAVGVAMIRPFKRRPRPA